MYSVVFVVNYLLHDVGDINQRRHISIILATKHTYRTVAFQSDRTPGKPNLQWYPRNGFHYVGDKLKALTTLNHSFTCFAISNYSIQGQIHRDCKNYFSMIYSPIASGLRTLSKFTDTDISANNSFVTGRDQQQKRRLMLWCI